MSEKRKLGCMGMGTGKASEQQAGSPQPLLSAGTCGLYLANSPHIQGWLVAKGDFPRFRARELGRLVKACRDSRPPANCR